MIMIQIVEIVHLALARHYTEIELLEGEAWAKNI